MISVQRPPNLLDILMNFVIRQVHCFITRLYFLHPLQTLIQHYKFTKPPTTSPHQTSTTQNVPKPHPRLLPLRRIHTPHDLGRTLHVHYKTTIPTDRPPCLETLPILLLDFLRYFRLHAIYDYTTQHGGIFGEDDVEREGEMVEKGL